MASIPLSRFIAHPALVLPLRYAAAGAIHMYSTVGSCSERTRRLHLITTTNNSTRPSGHETFGSSKSQDTWPPTPRGGADVLRANGRYAVLRTDEFIAELRAPAFPFASFHPFRRAHADRPCLFRLRLFEHEFA